jgi:ubiquinone/menaquinone biosynthesis C-methylase UbiE
LPAASFDVVHSSHVIEHVPEPDRYLSEIYRLLPPGGYCICVTPNLASFQAQVFKAQWRSAIADHVHLFSVRSLTRLFRQTGFELIKSKTWGGIAQGMAPAGIKRMWDTLAKQLGFGDVMIILARKPL